MGLSEFFVTTTFFNYNDEDIKKAPQISLPEIQLVLIVTALMYFLLGNVLEYIKNVELKIIIPIIIVFGIIKITVSILTL